MDAEIKAENLYKKGAVGYDVHATFILNFHGLENLQTTF